jgi:hypothetical protein
MGDGRGARHFGGSDCRGERGLQGTEGLGDLLAGDVAGLSLRTIP